MGVISFRLGNKFYQSQESQQPIRVEKLYLKEVTKFSTLLDQDNLRITILDIEPNIIIKLEPGDSYKELLNLDSELYTLLNTIYTTEQDCSIFISRVYYKQEAQGKLSIQVFDPNTTSSNYACFPLDKDGGLWHER